MLFNLILILANIIIYLFINSSKKISKKKRDLLFLALSFTVVAILLASRDYTTGTDTQMYIKTFLRFSKAKWNSNIFGGYFEPLYVVFNILISYVSKNPRILIITTSSFISYAFYKFIKDNSENYLLSVIIFIGLLFFYSSMNIIRQYMALSIILLGFKFVKKRKFFPFMLTVFFAYLFHSSALIAILIYPIYNMKYSRLKVIIIFVVALLANIFVSNLINSIYNLIGRVNYYDNRVGQENIANFIYMMVYFAMYLFSLYEIKKNKSLNENNNFNLYIFILSSAVSLVAMNMNVLARATAYFNVFTIICLPNVISDNINKKENRLLINYIIIIVLILYSTIIIKFRPEWNTAYNYKSCLINNEDDICSYYN